MNSIAWTEPIFSGISFGLLLAVMLGPVFFALLQTSLHEGFKAGISLAFGVFLSDAVLVVLCYTFASFISLLDSHNNLIALIGGVLFIGFGVYTFFLRIKMKEVDDNKKTVHAHFVLKGFLLNILNPAVLLFWLGVVGLVTVKEGYDLSHKTTFLSSVILTIFATDILKSFISHRIKRILKPKVMLWMNRIIGIILVGFGVNMILQIV